MLQSTIAAFVLGVALACSAHANTVSFAACGAAPSTMTRAPKHCVPEVNSSIELIDELLIFDEQKDRRWRVEARYTFLNHGKATNIVIGFPVHTWARKLAGEPHDAVRTITGYSIEVDRKKAKFTTFSPDDGNRASKNAAKRFGYNEVYLTSVEFPARGRRVIFHRLTQATTNDVLGPNEMHYLLRTGANWRRGHIGRFRLKIRHRFPVAYDCHVVNLAGARWDPRSRTLSVDKVAYKPVQDLRYVYKEPFDVFYSTYNDFDLKPKALRAAGTPKIVKMYGLALQVLRHPSQPEAWHDPDAACVVESKAARMRRLPTISDPNIRRGAVDTQLKKIMARLTRELTRRKVAFVKPD